MSLEHTVPDCAACLHCVSYGPRGACCFSPQLPWNKLRAVFPGLNTNTARHYETECGPSGRFFEPKPTHSGASPASRAPASRGNSLRRKFCNLFRKRNITMPAIPQKWLVAVINADGTLDKSTVSDLFSTFAEADKAGEAAAAGKPGAEYQIFLSVESEMAPLPAVIKTAITAAADALDTNTGGGADAIAAAAALAPAVAAVEADANGNA